MQTSPASGSPGLSGGQATPTTPERLEHVARLLSQKKRWPAFLGTAARGVEEWDACPSSVQEALTWIVTTGAGALDIVGVGPLKPVCQTFKSLIEAAQGAAEHQKNLRRMISWCAFLIPLLIQHGQIVGHLAHVQQPIDDFVKTTDALVEYATKCAKRGKIREMIRSHIDRKTLSDYEKSLLQIQRDIALVDGMRHRQENLALRKVVCPPTLPKMAAVPTRAPPEVRNYVVPSGLEGVIAQLIHPDEALAPYTVVGKGGAGKTMLVSAVVRTPSVREHFSGGIFWMRVGRDSKNRLQSFLQCLAREMGPALTDTPHGVSDAFETLDQVKLRLSAVASTVTFPRLVVLDDVWEREFVDVLLSVKLKVMVTTRDRSVVGVPGGCTEMAGITDDEALELLLKTSMSPGPPKSHRTPGDDVRDILTKVIAHCGRLPLVLSIAGSLPVVKGKGLDASAWGEVIMIFENTTKIMRSSGEQWESLSVVLEVIFSTLGARKKREFLKMAVLPAGAIAPIEMLLNLWQTEDIVGAREEARFLASKCLLQNIGDDQYRVHDLLLEFVTAKIKADQRTLEEATRLQAEYLSRLNVVNSYKNPEHSLGGPGLSFLDTLWRAVEKLSGDLRLEAASYDVTLGHLESCNANASVANFYTSVGLLFFTQGKYAESELLFERCQAIQEEALGTEHPSFVETLRSRAGLFMMQGKYAEAESLYGRCQVIQEGVMEEENLSLAATLRDRALSLERQGKFAGAIQFLEKALSIQTKTVGATHFETAKTQNSLEVVRKQVGCSP